MKRLWERWVALWDRREPATGLALVRICASVVLLVDYLWIAKLGMVHAMWSPAPLGYATSDAVMWYGLVVGTLVCAAIGAATPLACILFAYASARLSWAAPNGESGSDVLMRIVFPILALSRCNAKWSVDAWVMRRLGRPMPEEVPAWPRYLLMLQLVWVYFSGGQNKSSGVWGPLGGFTALANALLEPAAGRLPEGFVVALYPLWRVATAFTMVFELGAPIYLLAYAKDWRRVRWAWIALGVTFELGIAVGLKLGSFPYAMLALFPALLKPEEVQRLNTRAPAKRASSPS
jgi:hypothetical protein